MQTATSIQARTFANCGITNFAKIKCQDGGAGGSRNWGKKAKSATAPRFPARESVWPANAGPTFCSQALWKSLPPYRIPLISQLLCSCLDGNKSVCDQVDLNFVCFARCTACYVNTLPAQNVLQILHEVMATSSMLCASHLFLQHTIASFHTLPLMCFPWHLLVEGICHYMQARLLKWRVQSHESSYSFDILGVGRVTWGKSLAASSLVPPPDTPNGELQAKIHKLKPFH